MNRLKNGEIYLTKFTPAYRGELRKYRPSIIIRTSPRENLVTIVPLSSAPDRKFSQFEALIQKNNTNGLKRDSFALAWYIRTIDSARLMTKIGKIDNKDLSAIRKLTVSYINN